MNRLATQNINNDSQILCLRTHPDGSIPLNGPPLEPFNQAANHFHHLYLQSKHDYGRLVAAIPVPHLDWIEIGKFACSRDQRLFYTPSAIRHIVSRIQRCDCCGSSGRIEFRNHAGQELLQICAPSAIPPLQWGSYLQALSKQTPRPREKHPYPQFPRIPGNTTNLPFHPFMLASILSLLSEKGHSIEVTLANEASINRRTLKLDNVEVEDTVLSCFSQRSSFQLDLDAVEKLAFTLTASGTPQLYAVGHDRSQLLLVEAADTPADQDALRTILHDLVPELI